MNIHHIHLDQCPSTQIYLRDNITNLEKNGPYILVSTSLQTNGIGRSNNIWICLDNSLAFSFNLKPCQVLTLTPMEIGVLLTEFIQKKYALNIRLKWPNDLINQSGQKCGGIICHHKNDDSVIVGVGLNLGKSDFPMETRDFKFPAGVINPGLKLNGVDFKSIPEEIYRFILNSRMSSDAIISTWTKLCAHHQAMVTMQDDGNPITGTFVGLGKNGEGLIMEGQTGAIKKIISGSLDFS